MQGEIQLWVLVQRDVMFYLYSKHLITLMDCDNSKIFHVMRWCKKHFLAFSKIYHLHLWTTLSKSPSDLLHRICETKPVFGGPTEFRCNRSAWPERARKKIGWSRLRLVLDGCDRIITLTCIKERVAVIPPR